MEEGDTGLEIAVAILFYFLFLIFGVKLTFDLTLWIRCNNFHIKFQGENQVVLGPLYLGKIVQSEFLICVRFGNLIGGANSLRLRSIKLCLFFF